jgi:hypothetical protein
MKSDIIVSVFDWCGFAKAHPSSGPYRERLGNIPKGCEMCGEKPETRDWNTGELEYRKQNSEFRNHGMPAQRNSNVRIKRKKA